MSRESITAPPDAPARIGVTRSKRDAPKGHDIDVATADLFDAWLPRLGPSATLIWHYLARAAIRADRDGTVEVVIDDLAYWTGLHAPQVHKNLERLARFGCVRWATRDELEVVTMTRFQNHNRGPGKGPQTGGPR